MKDTVEKCQAFCLALTKDNTMFTFSLTIAKDTFYFSTSEQCRKVPARQGRDLKKAVPLKGVAPSKLKRKEERAADPVVRQKAAAHAAAAEAALATAPAEQASAAQPEIAGAAGPAGRSCRSCGQPTAGHVGRYGPSCAAAKAPATPETMRSARSQGELSSLTPSPVRGGGRQEATSRDASLQLTPMRGDTRDEGSREEEEDHYKPFKCAVCDFSCENKDELKIHMMQIHCEHWVCKSRPRCLVYTDDHPDCVRVNG
jgi:hypothetical protein